MDCAAAKLLMCGALGYESPFNASVDEKAPSCTVSKLKVKSPFGKFESSAACVENETSASRSMSAEIFRCVACGIKTRGPAGKSTVTLLMPLPSGFRSAANAKSEKGLLLSGTGAAALVCAKRRPLLNP